MVKNTNNVKHIILLVIAVLIFVPLMYIGISTLIKNNNNKNSENIIIDRVEVDDQNRILDYNLFYTLESITKQVIECIEDEEYDKVYSLMEGLNKQEMYACFEEYNSAMNVYESDIRYLVNASKKDTDVYVCEFSVQGYIQAMTIKLDTKNNTYKILALAKWGYVDD